MRSRGPNIYLGKLVYFVLLHAIVYLVNLLLSRNISIDSRHLIDPRIRGAEVHVQRAHDHSASLTKLLENRLKIRPKLIAKLDVRNNDRRVLIAIRPRLIIARKSTLLITSATAMIAEERLKHRPLLPANV